MNPPKNGWANASRPYKRQQKLLRSIRVKEKKKEKSGSTQSGGFSMDHLHSIFSSACSHSGCKVYIRHAVHFLCPVLAGRSCFLQHSFLVFFFFFFRTDFKRTMNRRWQTHLSCGVAKILHVAIVTYGRWLAWLHASMRHTHSWKSAVCDVTRGTDASSKFVTELFFWGSC